MTTNLKYSVKTLRDAGLEARWSRTRNGAPIITARDPSAKLEHQRQKWWIVEGRLWDDMKAVGVREAFDRWTILGDVFRI